MEKPPNMFPVGSFPLLSYLPSNWWQMQSYLLGSPQTAPRAALKDPEQGISTSSLTQHVEAKVERNDQILVSNS